MWDRAKPREQFVRLTVAGAAQAGVLPGARTEKMYLAGRILLLPVELRCVNHTASTNIFILAIFP